MSAEMLPRDVDVRMRGFARRTTVAAALAWLDAQVRSLPGESVPLGAAAGRVLAADVVSPADVPGFDRVMMDGYAVVAETVAGATGYNVLPLQLVGEARPGTPFAGRIEPGQAVRIMTGAPLPAGADAVLPAEWASQAGDRVLAHGDLAVGKHVGRRGEDVRQGETVLAAGRTLRPQDVGLLSAMGCAAVPVVRRPRVEIIVTGNELLPAGTAPRGAAIADANGPMLAALVARDGGAVAGLRLVRDDRAALAAALATPVDATIASGGSSVGAEDYLPLVVAERGTLAVHGIAMRPSSPTGLGLVDGRPVFLLPGNPVSCLCAYDFFAGRAIRVLGGRSAEWPYRRQQAPLARKLTSQIGRVDYARVRLVDGQAEPLAVGGAAVLSSTTRADGFVLVVADSEGHPAGAEVTVYLYD